MLLLLLACTIGDGGPATPGSPAAEALPEVAAIQADAAEIQKLSAQLEQDVSRLRKGETSSEERKERAAALMAQVEQIQSKNASLQEKIAALEMRARSAAGDSRLAAPPTEEQ